MLLNEWIGRGLLSLAVAFLAVVVGDNNQASSTQLNLLDLTGRRVEPFQTKDAKAIVFIFIRTDCPISNRYAPEVERLYKKFVARGIHFWLVYPDPDESTEAIGRHLKEYNYHPGALRDPQHTLVKMTNVQVTPEAAVFVPDGEGKRMIYRGRIDDRYVAFGRARPAPTRRELEQVLEAIVAGKTVSPRTTTAIGCFIPELR